MRGTKVNRPSRKRNISFAVTDISRSRGGVDWAKVFDFENSEDSICERSDADRFSRSDVDNGPCMNRSLKRSHSRCYDIVYKHKVASLASVSEYERGLSVQSLFGELLDYSGVVIGLSRPVDVEVSENYGWYSVQF